MYDLAVTILLAISMARAAAPMLPRATPEVHQLQRRATSISVTLGTTFQSMDGFGVSQAFGRATNIFSSNAAAQTAALDLLFSPTKGAGFTILRNRIGNDKTASDSILPTSPGSPNGTPNYQFDNNDMSQIWLSQKAIGYGVKTFYADAWGAPYFMKTNGAVGGGGSLCGVSGTSCGSGDWRQAYANFLVRYVQYYKANNITITHLGFLNEPEFAASYSSMLSSGTQAADFIKVLFPTIQSAGLGSQVKITCCDSEGWNNQKTMTSQIISAGVESQVGVITSHSYTSSPDVPITTSRNVWQTEYADLSGSWNTNWNVNGGIGEGLFWAKLIYNGIVKAKLSAYLYWEGAETGVTTNWIYRDRVGASLGARPMESLRPPRGRPCRHHLRLYGPPHQRVQEHGWYGVGSGYQHRHRGTRCVYFRVRRDVQRRDCVCQPAVERWAPDGYWSEH